MAAPAPDSPFVRRFGFAAGVLAAAAVASAGAGLSVDLTAALAIAAVVLGAGAVLLRRSRRTGEPAEQRRLLDSLGLAGEEDVLVVGDPRLADLARGRLGEWGRVTVAGDPDDLPHPGGSFDAVVSFLALHELPDRDARERACTEMARVLRPGGRTALLEYFRVAHDLELGLEDAGLAEVRRSRLRWAVFPPVRRMSARRPARRID